MHYVQILAVLPGCECVEIVGLVLLLIFRVPINVPLVVLRSELFDVKVHTPDQANVLSIVEVVPWEHFPRVIL